MVWGNRKAWSNGKQRTVGKPITYDLLETESLSDSAIASSSEQALEIVQRPNAVINNGGPVLLRGLMLPLSPSQNTYWRTRIVKSKSGRVFTSTYIGEEGVTYKRSVAELALVKKMRFQTEKRLNLEMVVCPRNKASIDIDNRIKSCIDALKDAGVFMDDEQIDELRVRRGPIMPGGRIILSLTEIKPNYDAVLAESWSRHAHKNP